MKKNNGNIIITGGAGFIGSHLVKKLLDQKKKVVVLDDFSSGSIKHLENLGIDLKNIKIKKIDLSDYTKTIKIFRELGKIETVYHLAARVGGIKYLHETKNIEHKSLITNIKIDLNVFEACSACDVKKIIYASSVAVYPTEKQFKKKCVFPENQLSLDSINHTYQKDNTSIPFNPDGGYGCSKFVGEIQLNMMKGVRIGIARLFNIYGVNEPLDERSHAISDLIRKAIIYPEKKFIIWGDGEQSRDYLYVSDCADALILLEKKISQDKSPICETVNLGSGQEVPINKIADIVIKKSGKKIKTIHDLKKPIGPISRRADISRLRKTINWHPTVGIEKGLKKTYDWIQEN